MRFGFLILLTALSSGGYALDDFDKQQIINRIKPVGSVRVQKDDQAQTPSTQPVQTAAVEKKSRVRRYMISIAVSAIETGWLARLNFVSKPNGKRGLPLEKTSMV